MPLLAAIDAQVVFLVIAGIVGLINWFTNKDKTEDTSPSPKFPRPTAPQPRSPIDAGDLEAERARKFREALGLPTDAPPPLPRPLRRDRTIPRLDPRMDPRPHSAPPPIPPARTFQAPPLPEPRPVAAPPLPRTRSLDELEAPTLPVEQLHIPELRAPAAPQYQTRSSQISASPLSPATAERDAYAANSENTHESLRALLRSPQELRRTFLLREILGPPRSLQS